MVSNDDLGQCYEKWESWKQIRTCMQKEIRQQICCLLQKEPRRTLTERGDGGEKGGSSVSRQEPNYYTSFWQCCFEGNCRRGNTSDQICSIRNH